MTDKIKTVLEPIDGARSRLTGESAVAVEAKAPKKPVAPAKPKKPTPVDEEAEAIVDAFATPIGSAIDRGEATVSENIETLVDRIERLRSNYTEWTNLSHVQRSMLMGALYAMKEVSGAKENGVPISFARFLGVAFK